MVFGARFVTGLAAMVVLGGGVEALACGTFDVASVKVNISGAGGGYPVLAPGGRRFSATNQLMVELILFAYDVAPGQIAGLPGGAVKERYDIEASCEGPMTKEQLPRMLQALLAERFHLVVHREVKEQAVYVLVPTKGGVKLRPAADEGGKTGLKQNGYRFTFTNAAMSNLVDVLSQVTGRKVVDGTGLGGRYDFTLSYAPAVDGQGLAEDGSPDSVFTALREQLGLNVETQKSPVTFVVVDRIGRLIPN